MTLKRLLLNNFGVYAGDQAIDLSATNPDQPIVLIGGENGSGKTTLLEALYLVLYGRTSPHFAASSKSYQTYLEERINDQAGPTGFASISVAMNVRFTEGMAALELTRSWTYGDPRQSERFIVSRDGERDTWLTENWGVYWNQVLPPNIAELFFFDGERIESLADSKTSASVIKNSVYALFGLSPITKLRDDLRIVEKKSVRESERGEPTDLHKAYNEYEILEQKLLDTQNLCMSLEQEKASVSQELEKVKRKLIEFGGGSDVLSHRADYKQKLTYLEQSASDQDDYLRQLAAGDAPFLLLSDLLDRTIKSIKTESEVAVSQMKIEIASEYKDKLICKLSAAGAELFLQKEIVEEFFLDEINRLNGSQHERSFPDHLIELGVQFPAIRQRIEEARELVQKAYEKRKSTDEQIETLSATLDSLPAEDVVQPLLSEEDALEEKLQEISVSLESSNAQRLEVSKLVEDARRKYLRIAEAELKQHSERSETVRVINHAQRTQDILNQLEQRLIRKHLSKLEIELSEKLAMLHSKKLVENVRIVPDTFEIELSTAQDSVIPASRLSAGERQLLALAVLWAVQSYSDKKMPMIVDTPLGRLDTRHRKNMVERFLTEASHQTIVLSTDSEVTPDLIDEVKDYIAAQYRLQYSIEDQSTRIVEGYFEPEQVSEYA